MSTLVTYERDRRNLVFLEDSVKGVVASVRKSQLVILYRQVLATVRALSGC